MGYDLHPRSLESALAGRDGSPALVLAGGGPTVSRGQLRGLVTQFANALRGAGLRPNDAVSVVDVNSFEFVVAFLGVAHARAVAAPLNSNYTQEEFRFYMEDANSRLVIVPEGGNAKAERAAAELGRPVIAVSASPSGQGFRYKASTMAGDLRVEVEGAAAGRLGDPPRPDDVALFLHTSGTTSRPKGVPLSQANLAASLANIAATYELGPADRSLLVMPLFHVHGLMAGLLAPLFAGAAVILPREGRFSAGTFWRDATQHGATFFTAVPTMHQILLARADKDYPKAKPPPLRFIRSCSSSLAAPTLHRLEAAFGVPVLEAYAMSEAAHQMTSNPLPKHGPHKPGTVGKAQGTVKVAILDTNNQVLGTGKIGEVCIQGPNVTKGYLNNPKANAEAYQGGWFHTGDQGFLDGEGYLTLTGRLKELINRGGEKISPLEVDSALLGHPQVAEAVSFAAPDEKYGEAVAAAVVLAPGASAGPEMVADIQKFAAARLAKFKVPERIFFTKALPKTATGKIQRRHMVEVFIKGPQQGEPQGAAGGPSQGASGGAPAAKEEGAPPGAGLNGYTLVARALHRCGVRAMYGVIGIPVTELASAAQAAGIRFLSFRNEQAAGYAAAAHGFLTGVPGVLLTVSGPGAVHGLAGLSHAQANTWPLLMLSGSAEQGELGKGAFQELDQVAAVGRFCKHAARAGAPAQIPRCLQEALGAALKGRPGAAYVDLPSDVLMAPVSQEQVDAVDELPQGLPAGPTAQRQGAPRAQVEQALQLLKSAQRPLVVIGKGAAYSQADAALRGLVEAAGAPFLATAMGRGVVPDDHPLGVNAARSAALRGADVALVFGARLNWQLHFGEAPRWDQGVRFILVDPEPSLRDTTLPGVKAVLRGDARAVAEQLRQGLGGAGSLRRDAWLQELSAKVAAARQRLEARLAREAFPLDYATALRIVRDGLLGVSPPPVVVAEGANTMDNARLMLEPVTEGRLRLDAGTWGTMGVGLGYAIAAAVARPGRLVVAVEGDSAFGFSGMECETIVRRGPGYGLPIVVLVLNNGGIYGGDRRAEALRAAARRGLSSAGFQGDPIPTDFVRGARYDEVMAAFGGEAFSVRSAGELAAALRIAFAARRPALVNIAIDPQAGVESGNVHAFNAPSKL